MRPLILIVLLLFAAMLWYQNQQHPQLQHNSLLTRIQAPLDTRLRYRIAEVDPRFGLSHAEVVQLAQQATQIWTEGTGQDYFVYDPQARLAIRLIYDERQYESEQRRLQMGQIEQQQQHWEHQQTQVQTVKQQIQQLNQQLAFKNAQLQQQLNAYNQQRQQLEQQTASLQAEIQQFNVRIAGLNQQVDALNQLNQSIDASVQQFNQRFQPRLFDKGSFDGKTIRIYEFQSAADLRLTLAHEFGHALGLGHTHDPHALMHPLMQEQNLDHFQLTAADLALLQQR
ncbi:matrixin family metalloprotease [Acinetobacter indicus]|uniref:matrixin family metalloprotease n=1 Tax=Acinetobacter indicus TaxID=756892 RepID=UPI000CEBFA73|nr:matrixin family metalloprotease [Acinetobacter indicus]